MLPWLFWYYLCSPDCPRMHRDPLACALQIWELKVCTTTLGSFQFNRVSEIPHYSTFVSINESNFIRLLYIRGNNSLPHSSDHHGPVCVWPLGECQALTQYSWLKEGSREQDVFFRKNGKNMRMLISLNMILMFKIQIFLSSKLETKWVKKLQCTFSYSIWKIE